MWRILHEEKAMGKSGMFLGIFSMYSKSEFYFRGGAAFLRGAALHAMRFVVDRVGQADSATGQAFTDSRSALHCSHVAHRRTRGSAGHAGKRRRSVREGSPQAQGVETTIGVVRSASGVTSHRSTTCRGRSWPTEELHVGHGHPELFRESVGSADRRHLPWLAR